jgi:hypothetical protein
VVDFQNAKSVPSPTVPITDAAPTEPFPASKPGLSAPMGAPAGRAAGLVVPVWYDWFKGLDDLVRKVREMFPDEITEQNVDQVEFLSAQIVNPNAQYYYLAMRIPFAVKIVSVWVYTGAGSARIDFGSSAVGYFSPHSTVMPSGEMTVYSAPIAVAAGDDLYAVLSIPSADVGDVMLTVKYTRQLSKLGYV